MNDRAPLGYAPKDRWVLLNLLTGSPTWTGETLSRTDEEWSTEDAAALELLRREMVGHQGIAFPRGAARKSPTGRCNPAI